MTNRSLIGEDVLTSFPANFLLTCNLRINCLAFFFAHDVTTSTYFRSDFAERKKETVVEHKGSNLFHASQNLVHSSLQSLYSKFSIIRPGCSRLLEFKKGDNTGCLTETFFQISRPGRLIEPKNWPWQPWNKTVRSIFSEMDLVV